MRVAHCILILLSVTRQLTSAKYSSHLNEEVSNSGQSQTTRTLFQDEEKKGFLSIPQDDPDPASRARRLSYRAPFWEFVPYASIDPDLANLTMAAPGGTLGEASLDSQSAAIGGQLMVSRAVGMNVLEGPIIATCLAISASGECLNTLDSYLPLYDSLAPQYQPAAYKFYDSDYAFARERITSSPAFITRVNSVGDIPFTQADVTGYDTITGGVPLSSLVAQGRLFTVDYYPLYQAGVLEASPNAFLEAPTAFFFVNGPIPKRRKWGKARKNDPALMPLAIKYNVQQTYVVSPQDPHPDWFLAKAVFNCLDRDVNAIYHFVLHTVIANVAIAAQKTLASEHPLYPPIQHAANLNFGIIAEGVLLLLQPFGAFDTYLSLSGASIQSLLFPYLMERFDWQSTNIKDNLQARGVMDIPGFLYRDDGEITYDALRTYTRKYLAGSYRKRGSVQGDPELQNFLGALTNSSDTIAFLNGFPTGAEVRNLKDVSELLAQILWISGVEHHALNSFRILNFDLVYPSHPGKILSPLPASTGTLTDDQVQQNFISGSGLSGSSLSTAQAASTANFVPDFTTMDIGNPLAFFLGTQALAFEFYPLLQKPNRLTNIYLSDTEDKPTAKAALALRQRLRVISKRIVEREAATTGTFKYLLLDPTNLPFYLYI
jgi:hypothetical protein